MPKNKEKSQEPKQQSSDFLEMYFQSLNTSGEYYYECPTCGTYSKQEFCSSECHSNQHN